jgi:Ca2+-binding RTX toxin-like protein
VVAALTAFLTMILVGTPVIAGTAQAAAPVIVPGNGFTVTPGDLAFILKQIKIAERHSRAIAGTEPGVPANPNPTTDPEYCSSLIGPAVDQIPDALTSYGLRTVDGDCNNLVTPDAPPTSPVPPNTPDFSQRPTFGAADQPFPRLTKPIFRDAEPITPDFPVGPPGPTSYAEKNLGNVVVDSQPRVISNLIDDQTSTNPAAVAAAEFPVRTQGNPGLFPCTTDPDPSALPNPIVGVPAGCVPSHKTLFIPNVTTDVGLSPPYNSLFTFFGQFFDHGVDQTVKSGGTVFVPLRADDPLRTVGPDGIAGTNCGTPAAKNCDEVPPSQAFMVLTRAQNLPGPDGVLGTADDVQNAHNTDTPWVDQSQTYTSHPAHQVFLREYVNNAGPDGILGNSDDRPVSTGKLLGGLPAGQTYINSPDGTDGIGTWAAVKKQSSQLLGIDLTDLDVLNVPMLATDPYGKFIPGPLRGLPQFVTAGPDGKPNTADDLLIEANKADNGGLGTKVPANVLHMDTPFLTDIAHNADPSEQDTNNDGVPDTFPVPDADNTPSADFANQPPGTYDNEMLDAHFICGDGRCNENIALSSIHQIFHSEHDRLVDYIKNVLTTDTSPSGIAALPEWQLPTSQNPGGWNGERLFQAARFVTEMEYQHLVFEEFARKVQPAIRPFHVYVPDVSPAIEAEFAHAVYRFGHSMLDDTVARTNVDPTTGAQSDNSIPLLTAFLNPPEYFNGGTAGTLAPEAAAGSVIMGSSDQVGNELDEFVTETLRNNLLGLPLDLPTLNLTRAREAGVPPLNDFRRQIFAQTNDGQLAPYTSWSDYGQHLKHPESLINFVAAYGTHPTIRDSGPDGILGTADDVTTIAAKRAAAKLIVDPADPTDPAIPADAADFMFSTGAWANDANGKTTTGLDTVDLWVGGLAEITNLNGGLLGSTFNYVFQNQLEKLQEGDRLYYLARTPGLNLRTQLEGNSFAELIERNTTGTNTLKADAFATADCKFQLGDLTFPATAAGSPLTPAAKLITGSGSVNDDATTQCDENQLLLRKPDGTIQYRAVNSVDPSGVNGQSVYNGTPGVDRIFGGNDNDTFWGDAGNDVIEGGGGDDVILGGDGNDIITDLDGADVLKGGPGNDALDAGTGNDIILGADGQDFMNGGANDNESFGGPGNDFIIAGQGADTVFGDGGDDWIEGGTGQDLLQGDHGAPFFDDPGEVAPGNDVFIGQPGENDYDAEGGDDVMEQNPAIDRNAGAGGFDWAAHQYDTVAADDDMMINNNLGGLPIQVIVNRDRWQETEADSGSKFNDVIKGTDGVVATPRLIGGAGFQGCDAIDQAGLDRIKGLAALLPPVTSWLGTAAETTSLSASGRCPLSGPVWGEGDILLGGAGSDTITGRAGNEIIDGDRELRIAISVRTNPADPATETGRTDLMENQATSGNFGPGTTGMTLQQAVFAGLVDPGNLVTVREIVDNVTAPADCGAATPVNCDTSVYSGPLSQYTITPNANGSITVLDTTTATPAVVGAEAVGDGTDTLFNIENLRFCNATDAVTKLCTSTQDVLVAPPAAPTIGTATAANASALVRFTAPAAPATGPGAITSFEIVATPTSGTNPVVTKTGISATATSSTVTGLVNGTTYTFQVRAVNGFGSSPLSAASNPVTPVAPTGPPGAPTGVLAVRGNASATVSWTAPVNNGGSTITGYNVQVRTGAVIVRTDSFPGDPSTSHVIGGLTNGTTYNFRVITVTAAGVSAPSVASNPVTPAGATTVPTAPGILAPAQGPAGGRLTAVANWTAPVSTGGSKITGYQVSALLMAADGTTVVGAPTIVNVGQAARTKSFPLAAGNYRFEVVAINAVGASPPSARSSLIAPR